MRTADVAKLSEVEYAILEPMGKVNFFRRSEDPAAGSGSSGSGAGGSGGHAPPVNEAAPKRGAALRSSGFSCGSGARRLIWGA